MSWDQVVGDAECQIKCSTRSLDTARAPLALRQGRGQVLVLVKQSWLQCGKWPGGRAIRSYLAETAALASMGEDESWGSSQEKAAE